MMLLEFNANELRNPKDVNEQTTSISGWNMPDGMHKQTSRQTVL